MKSSQFIQDAHEDLRRLARQSSVLDVVTLHESNAISNLTIMAASLCFIRPQRKDRQLHKKGALQLQER